MAPMNYRRGFNRVYLILSVLWAVWWVIFGAVYTPLKRAGEAKTLDYQIANHAYSSCREDALRPPSRIIDQQGNVVTPTQEDVTSYRTGAFAACQAKLDKAMRDAANYDFYTDANGDYYFVFPLLVAFVVPVLLYCSLKITIHVFTKTARWIRDGFTAV